jgi:NAD(P)-dependent dehydrogenase (short-subunit alcohol dehydrogenase family)
VTNVRDKSILITGANRGIGHALVEEALRRGVRRIYAGTRGPTTPHSDERVTPVTLDVTNATHIRAAAADIDSLDILINNAGVSPLRGLGDRAALEQSLAVNLFGLYDVSQEFLPHIRDSNGAIVNILSLAGFAPVPFDPGYAISKAAAFSLSQSQRAVLAGNGVQVHAVIAGPVDTDMTQALDVPKSTTEYVARCIFDGMENDEEEIFPDPLSEPIAEGWRNGMLKNMEREFAAYATADVDQAV